MALIDNLKDPGTDAIFGIQSEYRKDERDFKVNLTVGVYIDENGGKPPIMKALKAAEKGLLDAEKTKSYLGIAGDKEYLSLTAELVFGKIDEERLSMVQTVGGTSALSTGFALLKKNGMTVVSLSDPTWANHKQIVGSLGYKTVTYPQVDGVKNFSLVRDHLNGLDQGTVLLLQAKSHNPTGVDFTKDQWKEICLICKEKDLYPFFDSAYQGFATSLKEDAWAVRHFVEAGLDVMVAHSFSKSFAIYNERVGALFVVQKDKSLVPVVSRNLEKLVRVNYSNPPFHGAAAIKAVLKDENLCKLWQAELDTHRERINLLRAKFGDSLQGIFGNDVAATIKEGHGFFCQVPLSKKEICRLKEEYAVYMTGSGRVSLPGLSDNSFAYVIDSIRKVKE